MLPQTSPKWVNFFKDTTDSNPQCSSRSFLPSLPQWCGPPSASPHPRAGQESKWQNGLPLQTRPISAEEGQHSEEEGQEIKDNMFLGIHPLVNLKLTPSLIQNLAFGEPLCYPELLHSQNILKGYIGTSHTYIHHSRPTNQPTSSQI